MNSVEGHDTPQELIRFVDLYSRCRHSIFREHLMYNLLKFFPYHAITEQAKILHKQIRDDYPFRQAIRKVVIEFENRQMDNPQPGSEGDNYTAEVNTG